MKRPEDDFENVYDLLEHAIDYAFEGKMTLKFYEFLKYVNAMLDPCDANSKQIAFPIPLDPPVTNANF